MNINHEKLLFEWGRNGLHISQFGREIAVVDITAISLLGIKYGSDLNIQPAGCFITPRQKILNWLKTQNQKG